MRTILNINDGWKFIRQDEQDAWKMTYTDHHWEEIKIPHTWNAVDGANGTEYYQGACWYRREFTLDPVLKGKRIFIEFHGSNSITDVYVNEQYIGQHRGGYSLFRFDITDAVRFGERNILSVKVDNTIVDDVYPQKADFTFFGGIYRDVNIIAVHPVHIDLRDYGSSGVYIIQEEVNKERARLIIQTKLANTSSEDKKVRLWIDILDDNDNTVTYMPKEVTIPKEETITVKLPVSIDKPHLWHGKENPYLYKAKVSLVSYNDTLDAVTIPFGVRYFYVDPEKGFFLNGVHYPLRGVSRHQDRKDKGWALSHDDQREDMEIIKEIGATSIRLAHYQHDQFFYDLCDQEGMVVWAEIPFISVMGKSDKNGENAKQQLIELIRQNFNHPSIMFWGIQNEIQIGGERLEVRQVVQELNKLAKKEDPTRFTTQANVMFVPDTDEYNDITDVLGYNKYYGWYNGKAEDFAGWIDGFHKKNPHVPLCISEYAAEGIIEYHSTEPKVRDYSEEYHTFYHETVWKIFEKRPFLWGTYVWNMFDFGSAIRDEGGVQGRNNKGLVTYDRKIKKDAFYLYKAHWSDEKFVHITSKRFVDRADDTIMVKIYSNCNQVTLFVNGEEITSKNSEEKIFVFENVKLRDGLNVIRAVTQAEGVTCEDAAVFNKVDEPNPSYVAPVGETGIAVENWFEMPDVGDVEIEELEIPEGVFSTRSSLREIFDNEEARAIFIKYFGDIEEKPLFSMMMDLTVEQIATLAEDVFTEKVMYLLNKELMKIKN